MGMALVIREVLGAAVEQEWDTTLPSFLGVSCLLNKEAPSLGWIEATYTVSTVSLYDEPFLSYVPILRKLHQTTPKINDLDMLKVKSRHMHDMYTTYTPTDQFHLFQSTMCYF